MNIKSPGKTIVGQFYQVPMVQLSANTGDLGKDGRLVPVLLPAHGDLELGADYQHYHIDWRFVDKASFDRLSLKSGGHLSGFVYRVQDASEVILRRRKCQREALVFPSFSHQEKAKKWRQVESRFTDCTINLEHPICPHKGICLKGAPVVNGVIVCPGHGLGWDAKTGENVPRHRTNN